MLHIAIIAVIFYVALTVVEKLAEKDEQKKAIEECYEVIFIR